MAVIAYAIGSISSSVLISKKMAGFDVREKGSGNAGSTNVLRTVGKKAAILTLVCDILKGVISIGIAWLIGKIAKNASPAILVEIAALFVVIGHTYPVFFGFKGGKGVATSLGVILLINWKIGLACLIFALVLMAITRMVSLGSISAAVLFAVLTLIIRDGYIVDFDFSFIIFGILLAAFVIFNHRTNLKRIMAGTENKLSFGKKENKDPKENKEQEESKEAKENKEQEESKEVKEIKEKENKEKENKEKEENKVQEEKNEDKEKQVENKEKNENE
jgi:glycerol-3-phosphate acyltransferase PlsY